VPGAAIFVCPASASGSTLFLLALSAGGCYDGAIQADATDTLVFCSLRMSARARETEKTVAGRTRTYRDGTVTTPERKLTGVPKNMFIDLLCFSGPAEVADDYGYQGNGSVEGMRLRAGWEFPLNVSEDGASEIGVALGVVYARETLRYTRTDGAGSHSVEAHGASLLTPFLFNAPELYVRLKLTEKVDAGFRAMTLSAGLTREYDSSGYEYGAEEVAVNGSGLTIGAAMRF
jgi:hypothetical protein